MLFVLKDGKKSEFYTKFLVNVTDTVDYNECLKLLKSESLGDRFIVNSRCNFTLDSWKLVSLENEEDSEIKQVCSIKDRVKGGQTYFQPYKKIQITRNLQLICY